MNDDKQIGEGVPFQRLRRITGYLVGTVDRWNDGKKAELKDREKHEVNKEEQSTISKRSETVRYSRPSNS